MGKESGGLLFRVTIGGAELVELKRHWHHLPEECVGMQAKVQRHNGTRPLELTEEEFSWVLAILDAVLQTPEGYPLDSPPGQQDPAPLEFVNRDDPRCVTCRALYERLGRAYDLAMTGKHRARTIEVS